MITHLNIHLEQNVNVKVTRMFLDQKGKHLFLETNVSDYENKTCNKYRLFKTHSGPQPQVDENQAHKHALFKNINSKDS